jgi:dinuclear metal center YbgI/SA1388 family protein
MQVKDLVGALEEIAPRRHAEKWDNVGLLVGDPEQPVTRVLLAIDYTRAVAHEARRKGCEAVLAYHPPIFDGLKRVLAGTEVFDAVRLGIALYSPHTALDVAAGGTNDVLADILGLTDRGPLRAAPAPGMPGMGRVGALPAVARSELLGRIKVGLGVAHLLVAGPTDGTVSKAACCAGACGEIVDEAIAQGCGLYLTGELRHHDALKAARAGMTVVCVLHSNSERATLRVLARRLEERLSGVSFILSEEDRDPFSVI